MEPNAVAEALHRLVSWGLSEKQVRRLPALMELPATRMRALRSTSSVGEVERARAAIQLIVEVVARLSDPEKAAIQELLWIDDHGLRPRSELPGVAKRRNRAIEILEQDGYFRTQAPSAEYWRHGPEQEFLLPLARQLIGYAGEISEATGVTGIKEHFVRDYWPNDQYDVIAAEAKYVVESRYRATSTVERTLRAKRNGLQDYVFKYNVTDVDILSEPAVNGASIEEIWHTDYMGFVPVLIRFPAPLRIGDLHHFSTTISFENTIHPLRAYLYAQRGHDSGSLKVEVEFPPNDVPQTIYRVVAPIDGVVTRSQRRSYTARGAVATTVFTDLHPAHVYGFEFYWEDGHDEVDAERSS